MTEWIDREKQLPEGDFIIVLNYPYCYICKWTESKWGNGYKPLDDKYHDGEWTHWINCPLFPEGK